MRRPCQKAPRVTAPVWFAPPCGGARIRQVGFQFTGETPRLAGSLGLVGIWESHHPPQGLVRNQAEVRSDQFPQTCRWFMLGQRLQVRLPAQTGPFMRVSSPCLPVLAASAVALVWVPATATTFAAGGDQAERGVVTVALVQSNDRRNRNVRIHNQTGWTMTGLVASSGGGWTRDLLVSGALAPGRSVVIPVDDGTGACLYSLRAEFGNGETLQRGGINSCQIADYYFTR